MEGDIDERLGYEFFVPKSRILEGGIVQCKFESKPVFYNTVMYNEPKLRVVK